MKTLFSAALIASALILSGCASTNGGGYPDDCGNYKCGDPYPQSCNPCDTNNACNTCYTARNACVQRAPARHCMTHSCDTRYSYKCCDSRNYWIE